MFTIRKRKSGITTNSFKGLQMAIRSASENLNEASSVAIFSGESILMGLRRDSGLWSLPGGMVRGNESPFQTAIRELHEETGLRVNELTHIGSKMNDVGILVHAFSHELNETIPGSRDITTEYDPDSEILEWKWIRLGTREWNQTLTKLQNPKCIVLQFLGLL